MYVFYFRFSKCKTMSTSEVAPTSSSLSSWVDCDASCFVFTISLHDSSSINSSVVVAKSNIGAMPPPTVSLMRSENVTVLLPKLHDLARQLGLQDRARIQP